MEDLTSKEEDFVLEEARECSADLYRKYEYGGENER